MIINYRRLDRRDNGTYDQIQNQAEGQRMHIRNQIDNLTNEELFADYSEMLAGDDYDGSYTPGGLIVIQELTSELEYRLEKIGFLPEEDTE